MKRMKIYQPDRSILQLQVQGMVRGIQHIRQQMDDIQRELDFVVENAKKQSFAKGDIVAMDKLLAIRPYADALARKENEYECAIGELSTLLYTGNMFIDQNYYDTWIQTGPEQAIRIDYCPTRLEIISLDNI